MTPTHTVTADEETYQLTDKGRLAVKDMHKPGFHLDSWSMGFDAALAWKASQERKDD